MRGSTISRAGATALIAALQCNRSLTALHAESGTPLTTRPAFKDLQPVMVVRGEWLSQTHRQAAVTTVVLCTRRAHRLKLMRRALEVSAGTGQTRCDLSERFLGDREAECLAEAIRCGSLRSITALNLQRNCIRRRGVGLLEAALGEADPLQLRLLDLRGNPSYHLPASRRISALLAMDHSVLTGFAPPHTRSRRRTKLRRPTEKSVREVLDGAHHHVRVRTVAAAFRDYLPLKEPPSGDLWAPLFDQLPGNRVIVSLDLRKCSLGAEGARTLAAGLQRNTTLAALFLFDNCLGDAGAALLAPRYARAW